MQKILSVFCRFLQSIWFHILGRNGANITNMWSLQRNCYSYNDTLQKHESNGWLTWWWHWFFNIVAGVWLGDTQAPYTSLIYLDYVHWMSIDLIKANCFIQKKEKSRWNPVETIRDTDNADFYALLANTPAQAESLLLSQEQAAGSIGLHMKANKTEFLCFKQGAISTLSCNIMAEGFRFVLWV